MGSLGVEHDFTFTFTFHFHAVEKEMATHSSVLAWRIPGMGEPGGLPSVGMHRVGHDWSDLAAAAAVAGQYIVPMLYFCHYSLCVCQDYYRTSFIVTALNTIKFYLNISSYCFHIKGNGGYLQSSSEDFLSHRTCRHYCSVYLFESTFQNIPYNQKLASSSHCKDTIMYSIIKNF